MNHHRDFAAELPVVIGNIIAVLVLLYWLSHLW